MERSTKPSDIPMQQWHHVSSAVDILPQEEQRINHIARQLSQHSQPDGSIAAHDVHTLSPVVSNDSFDILSPVKDSNLDPFSSKFDVKDWARRMLALWHNDQVNNPVRSCGVAFKNVNVYGYGSEFGYLSTVGNLPMSLFGSLVNAVNPKRQGRIDILNGFDGVLQEGEMLMVLGPPGSGCSTLLKTLAGEMNGIHLGQDSEMNYQGIHPREMHKAYRGEAIYCAEVEHNFAALTVGETLQFAAECRCPKSPPGGYSRKEYATHMRNVAMAMLGISHTVNNKVGSDFIRGVSGGERKRVSIAEVMLADAPLQCWDNSTRGLDSATAIEFCRSLRMSTDLASQTAALAIYQAPQTAYEMFDKVLLIYEGMQIYFGPTSEAKQFFEDMGYVATPGQSTPDFLTSLTSPAERIVRHGFAAKVPQTASEFAQRWKASPAYTQLLADIDSYNRRHPQDGRAKEQFAASRRGQQSRYTRAGSPYTLSYGQQIAICLRRNFWRIAAEPYQFAFELFANVSMALIFASLFYNLSENTDSLQPRATVIFLALLLNAFASALEILTMYIQRPVVEKHSRYAFCHPSAEAVASLISSMPYKIANTTLTCVVFYFLTNLNRQAGNFFFFIWVAFLGTMVMSMFFRTVAAWSRSMVQALVPAGILIVAMITYTGFVLPTANMRGWSKWIYYANPLSYAFEALMINEFSGRSFICSSFVPSGPGYPSGVSAQTTCATTGSVAGSDLVDGDAYLRLAYQYSSAHKWRNVGIVIAFVIGFFGTYVLGSELVTAKKSKGEVLLWRRTRMPQRHPNNAEDVESNRLREEQRCRPDATSARIGLNNLPKQATFSWSDICYDIKIKGQDRRILDCVDGWVKPGQLTALMGVSGAGKTTLLDLLAARLSVGVVSGERLVNGLPSDTSFQRKTGYVQQQDLHLHTSTVREALRFSAILRQPRSVPREEKLEYVEDVLKLLDMQSYADAVVGVPGEGLNIEQRKRLSIGVELAAKPDLLLFLDEPTSGLDSQTSYSIISLLDTLCRSGQSILCTIHQPSAQLFERFDRLLFLEKGGKTVYFGEVGHGSQVLIDYFTRNGAPSCPRQHNPAEWMLEVIGAAPGSSNAIDWHATWNDSEEKRVVKEELRRMKQDSGHLTHIGSNSTPDDQTEFASTYSTQFLEAIKRVAQFYWRSPSYVYSKLILVIGTALFIGFTFFKAPLITQRELQNQVLSTFVLFAIFGQIVEQTLPQFIAQRELYEVRERPSKTYTWWIFLLANVLVETFANILTAIPTFVAYYYPIGLNENAALTGSTHQRGFLEFLFIVAFLVYAGTFSFLVIAAVDLPEAGGAISNLLFYIALVFCGVLAPRDSLPGFWKFMYYVSPFTYLADGILTTGLANVPVTCSTTELLRIDPPSGQDCQEYLLSYINRAGGYLLDNSGSNTCIFCPVSSSNAVLASFNMNYSRRWRDFAIIITAFTLGNVLITLVLYRRFRMPRSKPSTPS